MEMIEVEAFVAIAEAGSFTRAAESLHLSQPAVSRRVELLERELGASLFERSRAGARLTAAGGAFLPFARQTLAAVRDGTTAVRALESGFEGTIGLALVGTLAGTRITDQLRSFRVSHPDVRITLRTARSDEISAMVEGGEVTLGLRYFGESSRAVIALHAYDEELVVVCAGDSPLRDKAPVEATSLAGMPWVSFPRGSGSSGEPFAVVLDRQLARAGLDQEEVVAIDSLTAQKRLIEAGFGLGLLPVSSVLEELQTGSLHALTIDSLASTVPVMAIYRRDGYVGPAARRLLDMLTAGVVTSAD